MKKIFEALCVLGLIGIYCKKMLWSWQVIDIRFYDETSYLAKGLHLWPISLADLNWGYLYSVWYGLLSLCSQSPRHLYDLNIFILPLLLTLMIFVTCRRLGARPMLAIVAVQFFMLSHAFLVWPYVGLFLSTAMLLFLNIYLSIESPLKRHVFGMISFGLLTIIHPELVVGMMIYMLIIMRDLWMQSQKKSVRVVMLLLVCVISLATLKLVAASDRAWTAFKQHDVLYQHSQQNSSSADWRNSDAAFAGQQKQSANFINFAFTRAGYVAKHIAANFTPYYKNSGYNLLPPYPFSPELTKLIALQPALALEALLILFLFYRHRLKPLSVRFKRGLAYLGIAWLTVLVASFIIYPREHYLVMQSVAIFIVAGLSLSYWIAKSLFFQKHEKLLTILAISICISWTPNLTATWKQVTLRYPCYDGIHNKKVISTLTQLFAGAKSINLLEDEGGLGVYLPRNITTFHKPWNKDFADFIREADIHAVLISEDMIGDKRYSTDKTFLEFIRTHAGFKKYYFHGSSNRTMFVRKDFAMTGVFEGKSTA